MYGNTLITVTFTDYVFENAVTGSLIFVYRKQHDDSITKKYHFDSNYHLKEIVETHNPILSKVSSGATPLAELTTIFKGMVVKNRSQCIFQKKGICQIYSCWGKIFLSGLLNHKIIRIIKIYRSLEVQKSCLNISKFQEFLFDAQETLYVVRFLKSQHLQKVHYIRAGRPQQMSRIDI